MSLLARMRSAFTEPGRRMRVARAAFAACAALALVAALVFATVMLVAPEADAGHAYGKVERGDDYLVYTVPDLPIDGVAQGHWSVPEGRKVPDSMRIIAYSDLANLLAGKPLTAPYRQVNYSSDNCYCESWGGWDNLPWKGYAEVRYFQFEGSPLTGHYTARYLCGACDDPRLTLVWTHGAAWQGAGAAAVQHGNWTLDAHGQPQGDAPVLWRGIVNEHNFLDWFDVLLGTLLTIGGLAVATGGWLAVEARLARRRAARAPPPAQAPGTADLLRLVQMGERYLAALTGYFVAGGFVVVLAVAVVTYLVVPALLASARAHFFDPFYADVPILLLGPFLAVAALGLWALAFQRVRRERARWRRLGGEFADFESGVLER